MSKSGTQRALDAAQSIKTLKDIIQAALRGGWQAAALEAIKHFWPYLLLIVVITLLLPVIIFCCLPSMLFGFGSSTDPEISHMNVQAQQAMGYYENYIQYCEEYIAQIKETVIHGPEDSNAAHQPAEETGYEVVIQGNPMSSDWFITLYSVSTGNDLNNVTEDGIREFIAGTIRYEVTDMPAEEASEAPSEESSGTTHEPEGENSDVEPAPSESSKLLTITYLTPKEIIAGYSDADRNWAELMYKTMTEEVPESGNGELVSPFPGQDWRGLLTSDYGNRIDPISGKASFHTGLDLAMPMGSEIHAAQSGTVSLVQYDADGYGYHVVIDHGNSLQTLYGHCSELLVSEGQQVKQGDLIALVGSTGYSTGPHCHFEVRENGECVNPRYYLE